MEVHASEIALVLIPGVLSIIIRSSEWFQKKSHQVHRSFVLLDGSRKKSHQVYKSFVLLDGWGEKSHQVYKSFVLLDGSREKSHQVYKAFVLLGVSRKNPVRCQLTQTENN